MGEHPWICSILLISCLWKLEMTEYHFTLLKMRGNGDTTIKVQGRAIKRRLDCKSGGGSRTFMYHFAIWLSQLCWKGTFCYGAFSTKILSHLVCRTFTAVTDDEWCKSASREYEYSKEGRKGCSYFASPPPAFSSSISISPSAPCSFQSLPICFPITLPIFSDLSCPLHGSIIIWHRGCEKLTPFLDFAF